MSCFTVKQHWWPVLGASEESPLNIKQPAVYSERARDADKNVHKLPFIVDLDVPILPVSVVKCSHR